MEDKAAPVKERISWIPLELNPDVWNKLIHENGVDKTWAFNDIYGFDPESLGLIPQPVSAIIFVYPTMTETDLKFRKQEEQRILKEGQFLGPNVMHFKQTIYNACGMMALIHLLANNRALLTGPGVFREIVEQADGMTVDQRIKLLENNKRLAYVHEIAGKDGQTNAPAPEAEVDVHYVCFTDTDDHLYELDGDKPFPINHGLCTDLVKDTARVIRQIMERDPNEKNFSAMALSRLG
ncbi:ubiquitin C-terminal hydrolase uCHL1 [Phascolomyces articulosus]|uniref:Ubiquitin carboxyl-terminal hydrolase n=1 Tax=Phascolomyces articulosus TaxID=60185 RepID=A0AAD5PE76_9FUNG|nr:ubiquitin C-terminal hydrolase uCHL1 [Phascolomyces articulosus]